MGLLSGITSILSGPIGSIVGSVAGPLVSGLFQKDANKQNAAMYGSRLQTTVRDAQKAGIHPLEAIRAGAGSTLPPQMASLISPTAAQNAFDGVVDAISGRTAARYADERVQQELNRIALDQAKMKSGSLAAQLGAGAGVSSGGISKTGNAEANIGAPDTELQTGERNVTNVAGTGDNWFSRPDKPDGSSWQERYGEPGEWIGAIPTAFNDVVYNAALKRAAEQQGVDKSTIHENLLNSVKTDPQAIQKFINEQDEGWRKDIRDNVLDVPKNLISKSSAMLDGTSRPNGFDKRAYGYPPRTEWVQ
jgi:hypothetical protein